MGHVHVLEDDDAGLVEASREAVDVARDIEASGGHARIVEPAPGATEIAASGRPRIARAWVGAWPFVRLGLFGAAFAAGGILLTRLVGPKTAHDLGQRGGEGFTEGVLTAQRRFSRAVAAGVAPAATPSPATPIASHRGARWW